MRVLELTASNFKRIRAIELGPEDLTGTVEIIGGRNGQGKTSVLDAIWTIAGGAASREIPKPIRDGEDEAEVTVVLGDTDGPQLKVTRTWTSTPDGGKARMKLRVEAADGSRFRNEQAILDELFSKLTFDPLAFTRQSERDQVATLSELVDLPFNPWVLAEQRAVIFEDRTKVNRMVKDLLAQLTGLAVPDGPDAEASAADLLDEQRAAGEVIRQHEMVMYARSIAQAEFDAKNDVVNDLRARLAEAEAELEVASRSLGEANGAAAALPEPPDMSGFDARLADIEAHNAGYRARADALARRAAIEDRITHVRRDQDRLNAELDEIDERRRAGLAAAAMPYDGLAFDESGVTLNGVPFKQASGAEQLRVSVAVAMAANPGLRVIRITDGSLLDADSLAAISAAAEANDYQVWIERVADDTGIIIEDGEVRRPTTETTT